MFEEVSLLVQSVLDGYKVAHACLRPHNALHCMRAQTAHASPVHPLESLHDMLRAGRLAAQVCIFAYGQTGSGKVGATAFPQQRTAGACADPARAHAMRVIPQRLSSSCSASGGTVQESAACLQTHTMLGTAEEPGITPRAVQQLFAGAAALEAAQGWSFDMKARRPHACCRCCMRGFCHQIAASFGACQGLGLHSTLACAGHLKPHLGLRWIVVRRAKWACGEREQGSEHAGGVCAGVHAGDLQ